MNDRPCQICGSTRADRIEWGLAAAGFSFFACRNIDMCNRRTSARIRAQRADAPPHIAHEWSCLSDPERADVIAWAKTQP